jgi:prolyl oligopeptidase
VEVFRGAPDDVSANAFALRDADGRLQALLASRNITFYEDEIWLLRDDGPAVQLPFPKRNGIRGLVDGQLVFTTEIAWNGFETGDLLAYDLAALKRDPASAKPTLDPAPGKRESIEGRDRDAQHARREPEREREGRGVRLPPRRDGLDAHAARAPRETRRSGSAPRRARATSCSHTCRATFCRTASGSPTPRRERSRR